MRLFKVLVALVAMSGFVFAGCGDDDGDGNGAMAQCSEAFTACGGDPVGTWQYAAFCESLEMPTNEDCPEATYNITRNNVTGSININADGTFSRTVTADMAATFTMPLSCTFGMCTELAEFDESIKSCSLAGDNCNCTIEGMNTDTATGSWTVEGNEFVTDAGTIDEERQDFCVAGTTAQSQNADGTGRVIWQK